MSAHHRVVTKRQRDTKNTADMNTDDGTSATVGCVLCFALHLGLLGLQSCVDQVALMPSGEQGRHHSEPLFAVSEREDNILR